MALYKAWPACGVVHEAGNIASICMLSSNQTQQHMQLESRQIKMPKSPHLLTDPHSQGIPCRKQLQMAEGSL